MSKQLDTTGRVCQQIRTELDGYDRNYKKYSERRKEATERLRPKLQKVWAALESGETVNGYTSKEDWAHYFYNPSAKNGKTASRQIQRIINPKATSRRLVTLKEGMTVSLDGRKFTVHGMTLPTPVPSARFYTHQVDLSLIEVVEVQPKPTLRPSKDSRVTSAPPRQSGRTRGAANRTPRGIQRFKGTHTLLNPTITHCGIYYSDKPEGQFFNTCDVVNENPTCPACRWHLKRLAGRPDLHFKPNRKEEPLSEPAEALAETLDKVDGAACGTN